MDKASSKAAWIAMKSARIILSRSDREKRMKLCISALLLITSAGCSAFACAEEDGNGHYQPGTTASFIDMLPDRGTSTSVYVNAFTYYYGSASASRDLQLAGQVAANVESIVFADTSIFLYQAPWTLLGGQYATALAVRTYGWT